MKSIQLQDACCKKIAFLFCTSNTIFALTVVLRKFKRVIDVLH